MHHYANTWCLCDMSGVYVWYVLNLVLFSKIMFIVLLLTFLNEEFDKIYF